jgi:adenine-specific DNA-methyltransferase
MDKLKMHSPHLTQDHIAKIRELFPDCVTEATGEDGAPRLAVDFDQLRQLLSDHIVEGPQERYRLDWPGKREALLTANAPIAKTLRPARAESVDFDTTQNLFIEGDNLDALKLLQESYLGKVKMIYIDPPYNTGKDFVYADDFAENTADFLARSNQESDYGERLVANVDTNGRFHSDWLSMMYSRLKIARNFLANDGVIFVTIGDDEVHNLIVIMDEIFGESNFVANFVWEKRTNRENRKAVSSRHDYVACYVKSKFEKRRPIRQLPMSAKALANYKNPDNDPRGDWKSDPATAQAGHGTKTQFYVLRAPNGKLHELESGRCWLYTKPVMEAAIADGRIWFGKDGNGVPRIKTYLEAKDRGLTPESIIFAEDVGTNEIAKNKLKELFDDKAVFDTPKPVDLIAMLVKMSSTEGVVLDFFGGSGTTAEAVIQQNADDGGNRQFVIVQLPEETPEQSEARKAGFGNISEIGKERIRRGGQKVLKGECHEGWNRDIGFRVLKVDASNMTDVFYHPDEVKQDELFAQVGSVKPDRTGEDLLFQVLIDWGLELTLPIRAEVLRGKTVYFVDGNALIACFEDGVDDALVKEIATSAPLRAVFRDTSFARDADRINAEQLFRQLSPGTDVKAI